jgi:predicted nucleic acid-binding protein
MRVASALEAGCQILYSEDLQDGQRIENQLTIVNPFG